MLIKTRREGVFSRKPFDWLLTAAHLPRSLLGFSFLLVLQGRLGEALLPRGAGAKVLRGLLLVLKPVETSHDRPTNNPPTLNPDQIGCAGLLTSLLLLLLLAGMFLSAGGRYACLGGACVLPSSVGVAWYLTGLSGKLPGGRDCQQTSHSSLPAAIAC